MKRNKKQKKIIILFLILALSVILLIYYCKNVSLEDSEQISVEEIEIDKAEEPSSPTQSLLEEKLSKGNPLGDQGLPVLMYHFFYDKSNSSGQDGNWIEISKFEEQLEYLTENDYYFPTWKEVEDYIDNFQELPEKSVVLTVDDGDPSFFELAVPILQKYKVPATSFVVTCWYGYRADDKQEYVDYQSHSYDMHKSGTNGKGVMMSWDYDKMKEDVLHSSEVLGNANIFCYPFGQYNDLSIKVLKENGYNLAFTTENGRVKKGANKYKLPRVRISANTSITEFQKKV